MDKSFPAHADSEAQSLYLKGEKHYDKEEYEKALIYYEKAAALGSEMARYSLGFMKRWGEGCDAAPDEAFEEYFLPLAEEGHLLSLWQAADCCFWGIGTEQDFARAYNFGKRVLHEIAAGEGNLSPEVIIPQMCYCKLYGRGTDKDVAFAARSIREEMAVEEEEAFLPTYIRGLLEWLMTEVCFEGYAGFPVDNELGEKYQTESIMHAGKWLMKLEWKEGRKANKPSFFQRLLGKEEKATEGDTFRSLLNKEIAAQRYEGMTSIERREAEEIDQKEIWLKDLQRARDCEEAGDVEGMLAIWKHMAAEKCGMAMIKLGIYYRDNGDIKAAKEWFLNATLANFADDRSMGWYFLGLLYANGPETDGEMALCYFEKAAVQGAAEAWAELGHCYMNGIGSEKDLDKAAECFERGADAGDIECLFVRGIRCFEDDQVGWRDVKTAIESFEKVVAEENPWQNDARVYLAGAYVDADPKRYHEKAHALLVEAEKEGSLLEDRLFFMAMTYHELGDIEGCKRNLLAAAEMGYAAAEKALAQFDEQGLCEGI